MPLTVNPVGFIALDGKPLDNDTVVNLFNKMEQKERRVRWPTEAEMSAVKNCAMHADFSDTAAEYVEEFCETYGDLVFEWVIENYKVQ
jgi:hypothetical protein